MSLQKYYDKMARNSLVTLDTILKLHQLYCVLNSYCMVLLPPQFSEALRTSILDFVWNEAGRLEENVIDH